MNGIDLGRFTIEEVQNFWEQMVARNPIDEGISREQYVVFRLCDCLFALPVKACRGVFPYRAPTPLPSLPAHVVGVAAIRGRPLAVTDISVFFGLKGRPKGGHMLIVHAEGEETALAVD